MLFWESGFAVVISSPTLSNRSGPPHTCWFSWRSIATTICCDVNVLTKTNNTTLEYTKARGWKTLHDPTHLAGYWTCSNLSWKGMISNVSRLAKITLLMWVCMSPNVLSVQLHQLTTECPMNLSLPPHSMSYKVIHGGCHCVLSTSRHQWCKRMTVRSKPKFIYTSFWKIVRMVSKTRCLRVAEQSWLAATGHLFTQQVKNYLPGQRLAKSS